MIIGKVITLAIEKDYPKHKKLLDFEVGFRDFKAALPLVFKLPFVLFRRYFGIAVCRIQGKPYRDFIASSSFQDAMKAWREKQGFDISKAAMELGISLKEYIAFENGYKLPKGEILAKVSNRIYRKD